MHWIPRTLLTMMAGAALFLSLPCSASPQERTLAELDSIVAELEADLARIRAAWIGGPIIPPPNPDPGDSIPGPLRDPRAVRGPHPFIDHGWEALSECGPRNEPWKVQVLRSTRTTSLYPDQNPPDSTFLWLFEQELDQDADLVVFIPGVGGWQAGALPLGSLTRRHCIFFAGHAAPEALWISGSAQFRGEWQDIAYRGFGHIPDRRINDGAFGANYVSVQGGTRVHVDQLNVAFATNDQLSLSGGEPRRATIARALNGPTAGGTQGRGGGLFGGPEDVDCGEQSYVTVLAFEDQRRNPMIGCGRGSPVNVTNILAFNTTDLGRIQRADVRVNFRGAIHLGGPITGCARDRAVTWFDQADIEPRSEVYLQHVRSVAPAGCSWTSTEVLWGADHTVFHYSDAGHSADFELHGAGIPHDDPRFIEPVQELGDLERYVIENTGANFRLQCDGRIVRRPNDLSSRIYARVASRTQASSPWQTMRQFEDATGGPLQFPEGVPCADVDRDGIPDAAEERLSGSVTGIEDVGAINPATGWPWILDYLSGS